MVFGFSSKMTPALPSQFNPEKRAKIYVDVIARVCATGAATIHIFVLGTPQSRSVDNSKSSGGQRKVVLITILSRPEDNSESS